ncbi:sugar kinase [Blastochloris sulfoviridis]|uniref:Sugar kinase n=1 Tax=Blastochloris sulfoviridis TaxID=50712 RepID=A0A5M6I2B4_9HYPH|nr:sugar kinase [Blastochloris sulfoviridis]KAA5602350.1 sugar kinase [Blastochloris sulfoviridis]
MDALFIGHTYIDVTLLSKVIPTGDEKEVADDYAVSFGGNAVTAAFCCSRLGIPADLLCTLSDDWLGHVFLDMAHKYGVTVHGRRVQHGSLSFVIPKEGKRAILRARDDVYLERFPALKLDGCRVLHLDGHQSDAALHYAKVCRKLGIPTSLDGGNLRPNLEELIGYIDVAVVAEALCAQMNLTPEEMLAYLKRRGVKIAGVTMGERGMLWYDEAGKVQTLPALQVPMDKVIDTSGAGDIFHGTYVYSFLAYPGARWEEHFIRARAASANAVQRLGNESKLPTEADIMHMRALYEDDAIPLPVAAQ